jgi:glutathione synthase/RimK-type ligase-like ATP-grasp enzyme
VILILSNKWDLTVDFVVAELRRRGREFLRLNTEDLAVGRATISVPDLRIQATKRDVLHDLGSGTRVVWNRRPGHPYDGVPREKLPSAATRRFVNDQWFTWLEALQLLPGVTWINDPRANDAMENKVRQLLKARDAGFRIPDTLVTNDAEAARQLLELHGGHLVAKALYSPLIEEDDEDSFVFTNELLSIDESANREIQLCPLIFQECLSPKVDYRVTIVGEKILPVMVQQSGRVANELDWRAEKEELSFLECSLPPDIESACRDYVRECGLLFGAIDLVEYDGQFYFLEINPNGEWGWLQKPGGVPVAEVLCDLMVRYDDEGEC